MIIDAAELDATHAYKLLIGSIIPRAVAWVGTVSQDGVANLAPISFFTAVGRKPPMVSITLQPQQDGVTLKDTFVNIRDTGEFVTNLATLPQADAMHGSAFAFGPEVDEFEALGLEKAPSEVVRVPRVKGAPIAFECVVDRIMPVGDDGVDHVVWGRVVRFHVRDDLYLERGRIDTAALPAVGRLAAEYTLVDNVFTTPLDKDLLTARDGRRMQRLDARPADWSPIDTDEWSPSGAVSSPGK
ncbi:flavin reductase family protein [Streptomyces gibsoniae]|uniref:Flavin reductase family protein n=1 Tax=Streptomyces gibsoniae TaxID=3075529 RepID=A0ABU2U5P7_9ACTN|nr:flavin reductase family protein [Streptomyces sp. DSM 41699]MDT0468563.1 flavin reductase family protein [Streptomyces sp. DSM 41699]